MERFIAASVSTSYILIMVYIIKGLLQNSGLVNTEFINIYVFSAIAVCGILYSVGLDFFIKPKTKAAAHIGFFIFCIIIMLILSFVLQQYNAPYILIPAMLFHYIISALLNTNILYHDIFLEAIEGLSGEKLRTFLFHNNFKAGDFGNCLKKNQTVLIALGFSLFIFIIGGKIISVKYTLPVILCTLFFYFMLFIYLILIGIYDKEVFYAFLGFDSVLNNPRKMLKVAVIILAIAAFSATALSSNNALVKIRQIEPKEKEEIVIANPYIPDTIPEVQAFHDDEINVYKSERPKKNYKLLWYILELTAKILFVFGILFIVILLIIQIVKSGSVKAFFKERIFEQFLKKLFSDIKELLKMLFRIDNSQKEKYASVQSKTFKNAIQDFLKNSRKSRSKKNEIDRLTRLFISLIDWGSRRSVNYYVNMAPAEYTQKIHDYLYANDRNSLCSFADTAGFLFEKALYAKENLSEQEENEFKKSVKSITSFTIQ